MDVDFTGRRATGLLRVAAYTLLCIFVVNLLAILIPPPFLDPQRTLTALGEILERSTLPMVALVFLFLGMGGDAVPALLEVRLVQRLRPLLLVLCLTYLVTALLLGVVGHRIEGLGVARLKAQSDQTVAQLDAVRQAIQDVSDPAQLDRILASQPSLRQGLSEAEARDWNSFTLSQRRQRLEVLLERAELNVQRVILQNRAESSGRLWSSAVRLIATALIYAGFFLAAFLFWPVSMAATLERLLLIRQARLAEDAAESSLADER